MNASELKEFLDQKAFEYEKPEFITTDPVQIPHLFTHKEDIEIAGFLTATISWGNRKSILTNSHRLMNLMGDAPYDFIKSYQEKDLERLQGFVHRTFNELDLVHFIKALRHIYTKYQDMEQVFTPYQRADRLQEAIHNFRTLFFSIPHLERTKKHVSDPLRNSAAKRINMFLRWMIRSPKAGVDLGIWKMLRPAQLSCPLDVHSGSVARKLGLLSRKQNDAKALTELDQSLRSFDAIDPVKYDYALFGLGVFENFAKK